MRSIAEVGHLRWRPSKADEELGRAPIKPDTIKSTQLGGFIRLFFSAASHLGENRSQLLKRADTGQELLATEGFSHHLQRAEF